MKKPVNTKALKSESSRKKRHSSKKPKGNIWSKKNKPNSLKTRRVTFKERLSNLLLEIDNHIEHQTWFNASVPPHREITEALYHLVYKNDSPNKLKIEYNDGSRGKPFPTSSLWKPKGGWNWNPQAKTHLHIGTLSFRHVVYDKFVDMYLIRDKETKRLIQSEIDDIAYERLSKLLREPELRGESYISIYQTGLEPLVVGVYRAIAENLQFRNSNNDWGALRIQPIYFIHEDNEKNIDRGSIWGAKTIT